MLDAENPDIVVACGRNDRNAVVALDAARRGCHILSEKPAAHSLAELAALRAEVSRRRLTYALMRPLRYSPPFFTAHELVHEGAIGTPYLVSAQKSYRWGTSRPAWYADPGLYGSTMTWVGIHAFDYARWVAGVDYVEMCARQANLVHTGTIKKDDVTVVLITGNGLKTQEAVQDVVKVVRIEPTLGSFQEAMRRLEAKRR